MHKAVTQFSQEALPFTLQTTCLDFLNPTDDDDDDDIVDEEEILYWDPFPGTPLKDHIQYHTVRHRINHAYTQYMSSDKKEHFRLWYTVIILLSIHLFLS